jgi:hypothetical protein
MSQGRQPPPSPSERKEEDDFELPPEQEGAEEEKSHEEDKDIGQLLDELLKPINDFDKLQDSLLSFCSSIVSRNLKKSSPSIWRQGAAFFRGKPNPKDDRVEVTQAFSELKEIFANCHSHLELMSAIQQSLKKNEGHKEAFGFEMLQKIAIKQSILDFSSSEKFHESFLAAVRFIPNDNIKRALIIVEENLLGGQKTLKDVDESLRNVSMKEEEKKYINSFIKRIYPKIQLMIMREMIAAETKEEVNPGQQPATENEEKKEIGSEQQEQEPPLVPPPATIVADLNAERGYQKVMRHLLQALDAQNGIETKWDEDKETKISYMVRDAHHARSSSKQLGPNTEEIQALQMLMRAVGTASGLDRVLEFYGADNALRVELKATVAALFQCVTDYQNLLKNNPDQAEKLLGNLKKIHKNFNNALIRICVKAKLDEGLKSAEDWSTLLNQLRDFNSARYPAEGIETRRTYAGLSITESALPITQKETYTREVNPFPDTQIPAIKKVNAAFRDLILRADTRTGPQTRNNIFLGVKNGWDAEIKVGDEKGIRIMRAGALCYVGSEGVFKMSRKALLLRTAEENINALKKTADPNEIVLINLNTNLGAGQLGESELVGTTRDAARRCGVEFANFPANKFGKISPVTRYDSNGKPLFEKYIVDRKERHMAAVDFILQECIGKGKTPVILCASGSDRTGTIYSLVTQAYLLHRLTQEVCRRLGKEIPKETTSEKMKIILENIIKEFAYSGSDEAIKRNIIHALSPSFENEGYDKEHAQKAASELYAFIQDPYKVSMDLTAESLHSVMLSGSVVPGSYWYKDVSRTDGLLPKQFYSEKDTNKGKKSNPIASDFEVVVERAHKSLELARGKEQRGQRPVF